MNFLIGFGIVALVLLCLFIILIILMQRPSANAGMGSALGGGAAEQAFGAETGNILTKATVWSTIAFFVISFTLVLGTQKQISSNAEAIGELIPEEDAPPPDQTLSSPPATSGTSATTGVSPVGK
jgi:preprotein translocase subunit SecG